MASAAQLERVRTVYADQVTAVRSRVLAFLAGTWRGMDSYRDRDIARFVAAVVPVVAGGQVSVAALTDAYLAQVETLTLGRQVRPIGVPREVITTEAMRGVAAAEVYHRAGVTVWAALAEGAELDDAVEQGRARAEALAATDLQLAKTHAARHVLAAKSNVVGFRRVLESDACSLCRGAASKTYRTGELMPIHPRCDCGVEPIFGTAPAGRIDPETVVHTHGEIGPVLATAGHQFTGPSDL